MGSSTIPPGPYPTTVPTVVSPDPDNNVTIFCVITGTIAAIAVGLRLYSRIKTHTVGADDWASIPALVLTIGHTALATIADTRGGVGKPLWLITFPEYTIYFKTILASAFMYPLLTTSIRVTILLFYKRLFDRANKVMQRITNIMLVLMIPYVVIYMFITGFLCKPVSAWWHPFIRNAHCNDNFYYHYSVSSYAAGLGFDAVLLVLPMPTIWMLRVPFHRKLSLLFILALGTGACVAVATKLGFFVVEWNEASIPHHTPPDPRWAASPLITVVPPAFATYGYTYWIPSQCEPTIALIGCSLPALRPLFQEGGQKIRTALSNSTNSAQGRSRLADSFGGTRKATSRKQPMATTYDSTEAFHDTASPPADTESGEHLELQENPAHGRITRRLSFTVERDIPT